MNELFYVAQNGESAGPYTAEQVESMYKTGMVKADALVCKQGEEVWDRVTEMLARRRIARSDRLWFRILAGLVGGTGLHHYLYGNPFFGVVQAVLFAFGWVFVLLESFPWPWLVLVPWLIMDVVQGPGEIKK